MFSNFMIMMFSLILGGVLVCVMYLLTKKSPLDREQLSPFECGFNSSNRGTLPFSLRFFLLAIIFLIFDVELVILFPFLTKLLSVSIWMLVTMFMFFLMFLSIGLFHEWNQKMLEWVK